jgi:hypothetical protein
LIIMSFGALGKNFFAPQNRLYGTVIDSKNNTKRQLL